MNAYDLIEKNCLLIFLVLWGLSTLIFRCWNRLMRHLNIRKHGWPPPHCDADGDFRVVEEAALERQARVDALEQEVKELKSRLQSSVRIALKAGRGIGRAAAQMEVIDKEEWSKTFRDQLDELCKENGQLREFIGKWHSAFATGGYMKPVFEEWERLRDAGLLDDPGINPHSLMCECADCELKRKQTQAWNEETKDNR